MPIKHGLPVLDKNDEKVLLALYRFRYLTTDLISSINTGLSYSAWTKRLRKLLSNGFIDRPPQQRWMFRRHEKAIYALNQKGSEYLTANFDIHFPRSVKWHEKNRRYRGQDPFSHALKTAQFMIELEGALVRQGSKLSHQDEQFGADYVTGISWNTNIATELEMLSVNLKPDGIFSVLKPSKRYPVNFCLEIDRGTMPLRSSNFGRSSILKKFLSYADTHNRQLAKEKLGLRNFRVLILTTTQKRADNMRSLWAEEFSDLPKMCLFSSFEQVEAHGVLEAWVYASGKRAQF